MYLYSLENHSSHYYKQWKKFKEEILSFLASLLQ